MIHYQELRELAEYEADPCVSLYLPVTPANWRQDQTQLRSALKDAVRRMAERGHDERSIKAVTSQGERLIESPAFWQQHGSGVALFMAEGLTRAWFVEGELPRAVYVNHSFHVAPLIPFYRHTERFYVLAVSQNKARLLKGGRDGLRELDVPNMPHSLEDALWFKDRDRRSVRQSVAAGVHGAAEEQRAPKADLKEYARALQRALEPYLAKEEAPLIVAAANPVRSEIRNQLTYKHTSPKVIERHPEALQDRELHALALDLLQAHERTSVDGVRTVFAALRATNPVRVATEPAQVLQAAREGRVEALLVGSGEVTQAFGELIEHGLADPPPASLLDDAAEQAIRETLQRGGAVHALPNDELPDMHSPIAAIMRY